MAKGTTALIIIMVLIIIGILIFTVLVVLYLRKLNSCLGASQIACIPLFCSDGSLPELSG